MQAHPDPQVQKVLTEPRAPQGRKVRKESKDHKDCKEFLAPRDLREMVQDFARDVQRCCNGAGETFL